MHHPDRDPQAQVARGDRQYLPDAEPAFDVLYAIRPRSAMAWRLADYEGSQRRWAAG